jgi:hypothetical protein
MVIVPIDSEGANLRIPIDRATKRVTLLIAITADGNYLKPFGHSSKAVSLPMRFGSASRENGFIDTAIIQLVDE